MVSGARLPFEEQPKPADLSEESTDESDSDDSPGPRKELTMRLSSIVDCLNNLYRLSYKIRNPALRPTTAKAMLYKEIDPETNVDILDKYHDLDVSHIDELLRLLRQGRRPPEGFIDFMAPRLAAAVTLRRRCFKYWQKHSKKLSRAVEIAEVIPELPGLDLSNMRLNEGPENAQIQGGPGFKPPTAAPASTIFSKTDATPYDPNLDDKTERETVMSFVSTALDTDGKGIDLPGPPPQAKRGEEFTCPYCYVLCPAKQGRGKAWKQHVSHDLQPYVCTYEGCAQASELYRSRSQWVKHEDTAHRQCWRCFEHPEHVYSSAAGLRNHLTAEHTGNLTDDELDGLVEVYSSTLVDDRTHCPVCLQAPPFANGMANHLANHLERAALFALPRSQPEADESEAGSADTQRKRAGSRGSFASDGTLSSFAGTVSDHSAEGSESQMQDPYMDHERWVGTGHTESGMADRIPPRRPRSAITEELREIFYRDAGPRVPTPPPRVPGPPPPSRYPGTPSRFHWAPTPRSPQGDHIPSWTPMEAAEPPQAGSYPDSPPRIPTTLPRPASDNTRIPFSPLQPVTIPSSPSKDDMVSSTSMEAAAPPQEESPSAKDTSRPPLDMLTIPPRLSP